QKPSRNRDRSKAVLADLTLRADTALYEGVRTAINTTGAANGLRQVLLLSDGADNTGAPLEPVVAAIAASGVKLDAVSLEQGADAAAPLTAMTEAGRGTVISAADPTALTAAFSN